MSRLPTPGGDSGDWGGILNDYLLQAHDSSGALKADTVNATQIQDGTISESLLDSAAQTKLNAVGSGDWTTLANKPAVIAAGADQTAARTAIGAGTYTKAGTGIPASDMASAVQTNLTKASTAQQPILPPYVTSAQNVYDPASNIYNLKASNTTKLRSGVGKAWAGTALSHQFFIGDSVTDYYVGVQGANHLGMWPLVMRSILEANTIPIGGTGAVPIAHSYGTDPGAAMDPRWAITGSWANTGGWFEVSSSGATATFTSDRVGTVIDLAYFDTSGQFTVSVDGGSATTVVPTGAFAMTHYNQTGLSNATHTITVTTSSAATVYLAGASVYKTSGLIFHNLAEYGSLASGTYGWGGGNTANITQLPVARTALPPAGTTPDCVWISLGLNDLGASVTIPTFTAAITGVRNLYPDADVVLIAEHQPNGVAAAWKTYVTALYGLADTFDVPLLDNCDRFGAPATSIANGMLDNTDGLHLTKAAQRDWGLAASRIILG